MPVRLDEVYPDISEISDTTRAFIVALLYNFPEYGYRPEEVKECLNLSNGTARTCLKHLYQLEGVDKTEDGYYHADEGREDLSQFVARLDHLNRIFKHPTEEGCVSIVEAEDPIEETIEDAEIEAELAELRSKIEKAVV